MTSVDLEEIRKKYAKGVVTCAGCRAPRTVPPGAECPSCGDIWSIVSKSYDPSVLALCGEVETLRAQLAAPLRLGRAPTMGEVEAVAAKESDGLGWWMLNFGGDGIAWEVCSLHVEDGAVLLDSGMSVYGFHDITDAIPLDASRQPCGVGVKV